jgi:hypothetical protein
MERMGAFGRQAGTDPRRQGLGRLAGGVPVHRQLGGRHRGSDASDLGLLGERPGQAGVQPRSLARQQVSLDDLPEHSVADVVAVLARDQQVTGDRLSQRAVELLVVQISDRGDEPMGCLPAGHGHHLQHLPGQLGQPDNPAAEQVAECRR